MENQIKGKHDKGKKEKRKKVKDQIIITKNTFSSSFYLLSHERKSEERKSAKLSCLSLRKKKRVCSEHEHRPAEKSWIEIRLTTILVSKVSGT